VHGHGARLFTNSIWLGSEWEGKTNKSSSSFEEKSLPAKLSLLRTLKLLRAILACL
jgi:hypothetical protein